MADVQKDRVSFPNNVKAKSNKKEEMKMCGKGMRYIYQADRLMIDMC